MKNLFNNNITERLINQVNSVAGYSQANIARRVSALPEPVLAKALQVLSPPKRFDNADMQMQLLMAINSLSPQRYLINNNPQASRQRFRQRMIALQATKPTVKSVRDFHFDNRDGQAVGLRHYQPVAHDQPVTQDSDSQVKPVIVFLHGGGFVLGDLDTHDEFCHYLCHYSGMSVLSVDYRLAPDHPAPAGMQDAIDAVKWMTDNPKQLGYDACRIIIAGDSAGGNLATVVCQQLTDTAYQPVMQWLIYPVTDGGAVYPSYDDYGKGTMLWLKDKATFESYYLDNSEFTKTDDIISPIHGRMDNQPPAYIATAELDMLVDEGEAYASQLKRQGNQVRMVRYLGMPHGFVNMVGIHTGARLAVLQMITDMVQMYKEQITA